MIHSSKILKVISTITLQFSVEKVANSSIIYLFIYVHVFISPAVQAFIIISKFLRALFSAAGGLYLIHQYKQDDFRLRGALPSSST